MDKASNRNLFRNNESHSYMEMAIFEGPCTGVGGYFIFAIPLISEKYVCDKEPKWRTVLKKAEDPTPRDEICEHIQNRTDLQKENMEEIRKQLSALRKGMKAKDHDVITADSGNNEASKQYHQTRSERQ